MTRIDDVSQAFLLWLYEHRQARPDPIDILTLGAVEAAGAPIEADELEPAVENLVSAGLVAGPGAWGRPMPLRASLTSDGIQCVLHHGGDVKAWLARNTPNIDQSTTVSAGHNAQVTAHSQNVQQIQDSSDVNVGELANQARLTLDSLPALQLPTETETEVRETADAILTEAASTTPDHSRLRTLGRALRAALPLGAAGATLAKMLMDGIGGALG